MKFLGVFASAIIISFNVLSSALAQSDEDQAKIFFDKAFPVGTVISSVLPPTQFRQIASKNWVAADGRQIDENSKYTLLTAKTTVPDLRGVFVRGLNEFEIGKARTDGGQDPDGAGRSAGDYQGDQLGLHEHGRTMARWQDTNVGGDRRDNGGRDQHGDHWNPRYVPPISAGGSETRPKNVALYYYVKIN